MQSFRLIFFKTMSLRIDDLKSLPFHKRTRNMKHSNIIFGLARSLYTGPCVSKNTYAFEPLVRRLIQMMQTQKPDFKFNSISINRNFDGTLHYDRLNCGETHMFTVGDFTGGDLWIHPGRREATLNRCIEFDGRVPHCTYPYDGTRYSIVFYASNFARSAAVDQELLRLGFSSPDEPLAIRRPTLREALKTLPPELWQNVPAKLQHLLRLSAPCPAALPPVPPEWTSGELSARKTRVKRAKRAREDSAQKSEGESGKERDRAAQESGENDLTQIQCLERESIRDRMRRGERVRVKRSDAEERPKVIMKVCHYKDHVGENVLPLTSEFFYIDKNNYVCKQCKRRTEARRQALKRSRE